ncbi:hypothetical protein KAJ89_05985 [Candidatus Parcubacteria bacterium]|nr:hypothetical protein [Candidatus Parcubacteria bacterium]
MYILDFLVVKRKKQYLARKLIKYFKKIPKNKLKTIQLLEKILTSYGNKVFGKMENQVTNELKIRFYFLCISDDPIKIMVSIAGLQNFWCTDINKVANKLKKNGIVLKPEETIKIISMYLQAFLSYTDYPFVLSLN